MRNRFAKSIGEILPDLNIQNRRCGSAHREHYHTCKRKRSDDFFVLTIPKQLPENDFEHSGRGQEPSRGHKFSILENLVLHRDFTSQTPASFQSDLVGACLPQTLLGTDEEELCQADTIPPRISIFKQPCQFAAPDIEGY